jgi:hypothetical protein
MVATTHEELDVVGLKLIEPSLRRAGVELVDADVPILKCLACGIRWTPSLLPGGRLPKNWWRCPTRVQHLANGEKRN